MKRYSIVIAAATALLSLPAGAADLPRKAPAYVPPAPPPFTWTGFYLGLHAGWGWGNSDVALVDGFAGALFDPVSFGGDNNGVVGGFQIGYNWQFAPNWVIGIEGDISGTGIRGSDVTALTVGGAPIGVGFDHAFERNVRWLASIRGRLGYTWDRWMLYVTGGGAWGGVEHSAAIATGFAFFPAVTGNDTQSGWVVGGGVEYAFTNNWTARLEYLHYDLDDSNVFIQSVIPGFGATATWENQINVVRVGV